jgi:transposase
MARKEYKRYSREFKLEAVRLAETGERPKAKIARELGIRVNQLRKWRLEFEKEERTGVPKQPAMLDAVWTGCGVRMSGSRKRMSF